MPVLRLVLALLFLVVTAVALLLYGLRYLNTEEIRVPDLVGHNIDAATLSLEQAGLEARPYIQHSPDLPLSSVIAQNPEPGSLVRQGRSVSLAVNLPRENLAVPDLVGTAQQGAARALEAAGLGLGQASYVYSTAPIGQIVAHEPPAGASVQAGTAVDVAVSRGFQASQRQVPRVIGLSVADARRQLESAGFYNIEAVVSTVSRSGIDAVRAQSPEPGQVVLDTQPVTIYYNLADERVVEIPDLSGMSLSRAQLRLRQLGLTPAWISEENDPEQPAGVVDVRPSGWTVQGSPVVLVVNRSGVSEADEAAFDDLLLPDSLRWQDGAALQGGFDPSRLTTTVPFPAASPASAEPAVEGLGRVIPISYPILDTLTNRTYRFRIVVDDDEGQRTAFEQDVRPGDTVQTSITVFGEVEVSFYLDEDWVYSWFP
jgi:beta-lactam-binding protein with PASTA domain